jgi:hypothetical protein
MNNYNAVVISNKLSIAESGAASISIQFETMPDKKKFWGSLWLTEKAFDRSMKTLEEVFGWAGESLLDLNDSKKLAGKQCSLACDNEEYQGKVTEKVKFINKLNVLDEDQAASIAAKLQDRLNKYRGKTPAVSQENLPF